MALTKDDLQAIKELLNPLVSETRAVKEKLQNVEDRLQNVEDRLQNLEDRLQNVEDRLQNVEDRLQNVEDRLQNVEDRLQNVEDRLQNLEDRVTRIELHLENVTDKNIRIVAEGHTDLTRKLDDALKVENEKEMLLIRMNYLEGELERVKKRLSELEKTA